MTKLELKRLQHNYNNLINNAVDALNGCVYLFPQDKEHVDFHAFHHRLKEMRVMINELNNKITVLEN